MKQITIQKSKRKVNRTKRAKIGSHGFKVYKNTYVYIAKATEGGWSRSGKPAPKAEVVNAIKNHFNSSKSIRKMVKHIKRIKITYSDSNKFAGSWNNKKQEFAYIDSSRMSAADAIEVMIHEIDGHAFWNWAEKWRNEEWAAFNEVVNAMPPVNEYVATYQKYRCDDRTNTIYENEQHSAITEIIVNGNSYHKRNGNCATPEQIQIMIDAWEAMHY